MTPRRASRRRFPGSTQTAPTYWLSPANGVSYPVSVQTPQYDIDTLGDLEKPAA